MSGALSGKTVAILATDGFEQAELFTPKSELEAAGAKVVVVSPKSGDIQGFDHMTPDKTCPVDMTLADAKPEDFDALVLPGGANNPDNLRIDPEALAFVRAIFEADKPAGVICHAPWILIDAGLAKDRRLTSFKSIRTDLKNAGAEVVDEEAVVDGRLVTSRDPDDLPAFCRELIRLIGEAGAGDRAAA